MRPLFDVHAYDRSGAVRAKRLHSVLSERLAHAFRILSFGGLALLRIRYRIRFCGFCSQRRRSHGLRAGCSRPVEARTRFHRFAQGCYGTGRFATATFCRFATRGKERVGRVGRAQSRKIPRGIDSCGPQNCRPPREVDNYARSHEEGLSSSEVVIRQESAVVVSFEPMVEVNLVEV